MRLKKMYKRALKHKKDSSKFLYLGKEYNIVCVPDLEIVGFKDDCVYTKDLEALEKFTDRECLKVFTGEINLCRKNKSYGRTPETSDFVSLCNLPASWSLKLWRAF